VAVDALECELLQVFSGLGDADVPAAHWLRLRALADFSAIRFRAE
jgi:hypothetical protein